MELFLTSAGDITLTPEEVPMNMVESSFSMQLPTLLK